MSGCVGGAASPVFVLIFAVRGGLSPSAGVLLGARRWSSRSLRGGVFGWFTG
ncbi:hypothetical protein [Actinoalloteichus sp. GBA129-24]|uniref:hypothetical protein n=1 Tax=Actinoalloteichus sp. GBA129-24 TaxID=1612551 RepID=UPI001E545AF9|nr:hypothetical protein [Actinoalloteichus sp. GBA129-24]